MEIRQGTHPPEERETLLRAGHAEEGDVRLVLHRKVASHPGDHLDGILAAGAPLELFHDLTGEPGRLPLGVQGLEGGRNLGVDRQGLPGEGFRTEQRGRQRGGDPPQEAPP